MVQLDHEEFLHLSEVQLYGCYATSPPSPPPQSPSPPPPSPHFTLALAGETGGGGC